MTGKIWQLINHKQKRLISHLQSYKQKKGVCTNTFLCDFSIWVEDRKDH